MKCKNCLHRMIILIIGLLPSVVVSGQTAPAPKPAQTVVKGIVRDDKGQPLDGVSITLKGSATSVISTEDGSFSIRVPDTRATLVFTFVNYTRKEVPLNGRTTLAVSMLTDKKAMDEVVIIGYGTQKKREVTSAISSIKAGEIEKYNVTSFQQALQGQMPGVEMYESSGVPGAAVNVRIRGLNTVNGSAGPLYVVDGIPIISGGGGDGDGPITNDGGFGGSGTNGLTDINPADIESIEVLKDAASAAIYGARGSGGVVLITTKRAKAGKTTFNLNIINGFNRMSNRRELLDGPQLLTILDEAHRNTFYSNPANAGLPLTATPMPGIKNFDRGMADTTNIDYLDQILRTGLYHEATLTAMNGSERTKFYISGTFKRTEGNISGSDMNQYNFRINIDHSWNKAIRFGASIAPSLNKEFRLGSGTAIQYGGYGAATTTNLPIYPLRNADGTYFNAWTNPMAYRNRDLYENTSRRVRLLASAYFEADLLPGLKSKTIVQREDFDQVGDYYIDGLLRLRSSSSVTPFPDDQLSMAGMQNSYGWANSFESYFTYDKRFRKKHHVNIVLGTRYNEVDTKYEAMYGENFANRHQVNPSQAAFVTNGWQTGAVGEPAATLGYYFRTNYKFKDRYLAGFTINRDGSSRFGSNQRFGTFPAASVGWIISDEPFMRNVKGIDLLKVRFSGGLTGNAQGISNTASIRTWGTSVNSSGYMNTATTIPNRPGNTSLRWEKGRKFDAGLDIAFLRNRLEATVDVYHYTTTDMLLEIPVGTTFGYAQPSVNISFLENRGSLVNKGIEFSVNSVNTTGRLTWKTNFNISVNQTRIVDLGGLNPETVSGGSGYTQLYVGNQGPVYYLVEWAGVDPATGREMIYDADGKKVIASTLNAQQLAAARKPQFDKLPAPKFYGGIGNTFSFKQWTLSVFFSYRVGNWILDAGERQASYVGNLPVNYSNAGQSVAIGNISSRVWDRWTTPGQETDVPKPFYNDAANDVLKTLNTTRFLSDASFIRLKNLNLQYTIPAKAYSRLKLKSARVFFTGQNLFLLTKFDGVDPEALNVTGTNRDRNLAYGIINNVVPLARSFTLGFSVGF